MFCSLLIQLSPESRPTYILQTPAGTCWLSPFSYRVSPRLPCLSYVDTWQAEKWRIMFVAYIIFKMRWCASLQKGRVGHFHRFREFREHEDSRFPIVLTQISPSQISRFHIFPKESWPWYRRLAELKRKHSLKLYFPYN